MVSTWLNVKKVNFIQKIHFNTIEFITRQKIHSYVIELLREMNLKK